MLTGAFVIIVWILGVLVTLAGAGFGFWWMVRGYLARYPHKLITSGARMGDAPFSPSEVDNLLEDLKREAGDFFKVSQAQVAGAFDGWLITFVIDEDKSDGRNIPGTRYAGVVDPNGAARTVVAVWPGDKLGNTAFAYEATRKLKHHLGHGDWDADNRRDSPSRWGADVFAMIARVDERHQ
jgi:hypothetical protein